MTSSDYKGMTKEKLVALAKRKKAAVTASMKKDEVIKALVKADKAAEKKPAKKAAKPAAQKKKPAAKAKSAPAKKKAAATKKPAVNKAAAPAKKKAASKPVEAVKKAAPKKAAAKPAVKKTEAKPEKKVAIPKKEAIAKPAAKKTVTKPAQKAAAPKKTADVKPAAKVKRPKTPAPAEQNNWDIPTDAKKFFAVKGEKDYASISAHEHLVESYGENKLVALARDPFSIYLYWEIQGDKAEETRKSLKMDWDRVRWILRVYDVTGIDSAEAGMEGLLDVAADPLVKSQYLNVERDGREYIVALGLLDDTGAFKAAVVSNRVRTPGAGVFQSADSPEAQERLATLSAAGHPGSLFGEDAASLDVSSFGFDMGASENAAEFARRTDFSLWADCELTVYGGASPGVKVTLQGREIGLRSDGTFSMKMAFPDGSLDIPIRGTSPGGTESKQIEILTARSTRVTR